MTTSLMGPSRMNKRRSRRWSPTWRCTPTSLSRFQYFYNCFRDNIACRKGMKFFNLVSIMFSHHSGKNGMCCKFISHPESEFQIPQVIFALFLGPWSDRAGHIKMLVDKCRQFEGTFEKSLRRKFYRYYQCYL